MRRIAASAIQANLFQERSGSFLRYALFFVNPLPEKSVRIHKRLLLSALIAAWLPWSAACSDSEDERIIQLSYEAIPGTGVALDMGPVDVSGSDYAAKLDFTQDVFEQLVPEVIVAMASDHDEEISEITPGGFLLETNPSMQTRLLFTGDRAAADGHADRLAAALGYVMYQWSVLIADFAADDGATGYATVQFSDALTPELAQQFFAHAATVDDGLGGGYTAFDNDMIFLNLRDSSGAPFSGLDDESFITALEQAA
ncbi:MAG: hypothetical protein AAGC55_16280, partial [Myxococcota bacterium]